MARIDRLHIGIFGRTNAGKSTLMNVLTQQETSLVDPTPGTTADIKTALMEVHALGPVKLFDTAGLDEGKILGAKKRQKTFTALEQVDIAIVVADPVHLLQSGDLDVEEAIATACRKLGRTLVMVCNIHEGYQHRLAALGLTLEQAVDHCRSALVDRGLDRVAIVDLKKPEALKTVLDLIVRHRPEPGKHVELLPFVGGRGAVLLHIPLDEEAPSGRLLRPQEMVLEYLLRLRIPVGVVRVDLKLARSENEVVSSHEREKFMEFYEKLGGIDDVQLVLTDSQAIDLMHRWLPEKAPLTTFSVMMIHQSCGGNLQLFAEGTRVLNDLAAGDRVLIAEACNHDRMAEDIGTVQIPHKLAERIPGVQVDHAFGREFPDIETLSRYKLAIHCGGCMISKQQAAARVSRLVEAGIAVSNYGLALAWFEGSDILDRVLRPWLTPH